MTPRPFRDLGASGARRRSRRRTTVLLPSGVYGEEGAEVVGQDARLVDGDEGSTVVDPHQLGVLEVFGKSFGVGGGHELVVSCPDDEDRAGERALLVGPLEQLLRLGDVAEVLVEVAADLAVVGAADGSSS